MKAWHIVGKTLRDGRPIPVDGIELRHKGEVKLGQSGLHACKYLIDALSFADGTTICRVECNDICAQDSHTVVCRERKILWRVNGDDLLRQFGRMCALNVANLWDMPSVTRDYLTTGDESLRVKANKAVNSKINDAGDTAATAEFNDSPNAPNLAAAYTAMESACIITSNVHTHTSAYSAANYAAFAVAYREDHTKNAKQFKVRKAQNKKLEEMAENENYDW